MLTLSPGDVLNWSYLDGSGTAVAGGQGLVADNLTQVVERTAYNLRIRELQELTHGASRIWVSDNIFRNREFKLSVDKRPVLDESGKPVIVGGVVQYA